MQNKSQKVISMMTMALITSTAVASIRGLPSMAPFGWANIFLYIIPAIIFMVPTALVAAELASAWKGGIFVWVREAYGERSGFVAIWLQWALTMAWYPVQLAFFASSLAYVFDPSLANSGLFTGVIILVVYWGSTLISLRGVGFFTKLSSQGFVIGTVIPAAALIIFCVVWLMAGGHSELPPLTGQALLPQWTGFSSIVLVVSSFLAYTGMEMNAVHISNMENPRKNYPRAILLSSVITLFVFILPTLAISAAVPADKINLTQGVLQAFQVFFDKLHMPWGTPVLALLIVIGVMASVVTWIPGPSRGLLLVGQDGYLPPWLQKTNSKGIQINILLVQGIVVTILAIFFAFSASVQNDFWFFSMITVQLYLIMYVLMFLAGMKLRKKKPEVKRGYRVPVMSFIGWLGIAASLAAFTLGFVLPPGANETQTFYAAGLVIGIILLGAPPFIIYALRKESWNLKNQEEMVIED